MGQPSEATKAASDKAAMEALLQKGVSNVSGHKGPFGSREASFTHAKGSKVIGQTGKSPKSA